ncbi:unnamed protein product [Rhodiola kirilowii]
MKSRKLGCVSLNPRYPLNVEKIPCTEQSVGLHQSAVKKNWKHKISGIEDSPVR